MSGLVLHLLRRRSAAGVSSIYILQQRCSYPYGTAAAAAPTTGGGGGRAERKGKWLTLPPFESHPFDASSVGRELVRGPQKLPSPHPPPPGGVAGPTTALKWVLRCCPRLPVVLIHKLFRLRQIRREVMTPASASCEELQTEQNSLRRVSASDVMSSGDVIFLPMTVKESPPEKSDYCYNEDEMDYIRSLELYKDEAIIVVNKPPGLPVQGGTGIKLSMDVLAGASLRYDYSEPPRLVHRLDRDSSGILVLGRTQTSASILHSIFHEKTIGAFDNIENAERTLKKKYWALVIGTPKRSKGLISAPLAKVVLENGKSERITIASNGKIPSSQHALTEYKVIGSSTQGHTWLELCPLTGRKHQLRVHCAAVLGTPIVGDHKYGWFAHKNWKPLPLPKPACEIEKVPKQNPPFGLDLEGGSILEERPSLHLHCRQMILPNVSVILQHLQSSLSSLHDLSKLESLNLVAPLPSHMQRSWDILNYRAPI